MQNIFKSGELNEEPTTKGYLVVQKEGSREINRIVKTYNLDAIISVGYRINSLRGTQFRIWATKRIHEYIVKGFALNDDRFKTGSSMNYFNELQDRIREKRNWFIAELMQVYHF